MAQASSDVAVARSAPRARLSPARPGRDRISGRAALLVVLLAILLYLIVPPLYTVVETSFFQVDARGIRGALTLANYAALLQQGHLLESFLNTVAFGLGSTFLALVLGGALAVIVSRTNTPLRGLGHAVAFTSLAVPYVLYTIAWLLILGKRGPVNLALMSIFGLSSPPIDAYSLWTMIAIEGFLWSPLSFLMLSTTFRAMDPALEESGMASGAGVWQTLTRITLPLAWPAILSTGLLVFIRAFESFEIPALIGMPGRIYVLTTQVYQDTKLTPPDYGGASAYAVVLMAFVLLALRFYGRATQQATRFATVSGKAYRPRMMDLGPLRFATSALVVLYFLLLVVAPFALIVWASVMPFYTPPGLDPLLRLTTAKNFVAILTQPSFAEAMRNTVVVGVASATLTVILTALASWVVVKSKLRGRMILDQTAALPLVFPGIVLGLAVLQVYLRVPIPIYGTIWILAVAYVTRYVPYGMRFGNTGLLQIHQELEEAAATSGAAFWKTYRAVMLPLLAPALLASWIFIFLLSTKELSMTVLLAGPRSQVMSVAFFDLWNNGQVTEVAAFGVLWSAALVLLTGGLYLIGRRYGIQVQR